MVPGSNGVVPKACIRGAAETRLKPPSHHLADQLKEEL